MRLPPDFTFPPYEFREYPKWVERADGSRVIIDGPDDDIPEAAGGDSSSPARLLQHPIKRRGRPPKAKRYDNGK